MANGFFNLITGKEDRPDQIEPAIHEIDEEVRYSEDLLDDYWERRQNWATIAKKNLEYRSNNQIDSDIREKLKNLNQAPAQFNIIHPNVELAKQFLTHRDPKFQATAREDSDVQMARAVSMIMTHIWDKSDGNIEFETNVDEYYVGGVGCLCAYIDPDADGGRGEVRIKSVDPFKVYIDPNSEDRYARDAAHIIISDTMTDEQVQSNYLHLDENLMEKIEPAANDDRRPVMDRNHPEEIDVGQVKTDVEDDYYEVIDRYSKIKADRFNVFEEPTGREYNFTQEQFDEYEQEPAAIVRQGDEGDQGREVVIDESALQELRETVEEIGGNVFHFIPQQAAAPNGQIVVQPVIAAGEPGPEAIPGSRTEVEFTNKREVLGDIAVVDETRVNRIKRSLSVGRQMLLEETLEIENYPIVPVFNNHSRNPYPLSDVFYVRDIQDALNKTMSDILAHLANSKSTRVMVPRGSDRDEIEKMFRKSGVAIAEVDMDIGTPVIATPAPLSNEVYMMVEKFEKKAQDIFGVYGVSAGDPSDIPRTFNATLMLDENAQRRMGPKIKSLYGQLNVLADVVLSYAQQIYDKQKLRRILQPNFQEAGVPVESDVFYKFKEEVIERFDDFGVAQFDIDIVSGSTLPNNRWARLESYIKLYQMGLIDDITVLRNTDVAEIEEVITRKSQLSQAKQIIQQQEEQIKKQQGDMQTLERETVNARQQKELEKTKSKLKELEVRAEADLAGFKQNLDRDLADRKKQGASEGAV